MVKKYQIRLNSRQILGPYLLQDIQDLLNNSKINGEEFFQYYPVGKWNKIDHFPEIQELLDSTKILETESKSTIIKMTLDDNESEQNNFTEFDYKKNRKSDLKDLTNTVTIENTKEINKENNTDKNKENNVDKNKENEDIAQNINKEINKSEYNNDKTKIISIARKSTENFEKTKIIRNVKSLLEQEDDEKETNENNKDNNNNDASVDKESDFKKIITFEDSTEIINLKNLLPALKKEIAESEKQQEVILHDDTKDDQETIVEVALKKKGMKPVVAICFLAIIYMLMFEDKKELPLKPFFITINTPIVSSILDVNKAKLYFKKGLILYKKQTYLSSVKAYKYFIKSVENQYNDNPAFGFLVLTGSQIFMEGRNKFENANVIFDLLQMKDSLKINDESYVIGASTYFRHLKKYKTSQYYLDNYIRIKKKLTPRLLNEYIKVALLNGDFTKAKKFINNINSMKYKSLEGYLNVAHFYFLNEDLTSELKTIKAAIQLFPKKSILYLYLLDILKRNNNFKKIDQILSKLKKLKADNRPSYFAKFYEYLGYHYASLKKIQKATKFFKKSLSILDSQDLRSRLASLDVDGKTAQRNLILESKVVKMISKIKKYIKHKKWFKAFTLSIDSVELYPGYIPSSLLLAHIQNRRGYFIEAIKILKDLKENYPQNVRINFSYIDNFIESGKLTRANIEINLLGNTRKISQTWQYAHYLAKYYVRSHNFVLALYWLTESLKRNPLNSKEYYNMAELYFKNGRFKKSKYYLNKALFLEPKNISFHILYSSILYELEGIDTSIGYLRNLLKTNPKNIEILSRISIFYYKDGKVKDFELMKTTIEKLHSTDPSFYRFLIRSAEIAGNNNKLIKHSYKLSEVDPADIKNKLKLGQYLYIESRFSEANKVFQDILDRLPSYPRVHYYKSKIFLAQNKPELALVEAKLEIKHNPNIYYGYFVAGESYRRMEKYGSAIKNLEKALSIDRSVIEILTSLGWIRLKQNFLNPALEFYSMAKRLDPNDPGVHKNLALIYEKIGQRKLASEEYSTYLKLVPNAKDQTQIEGIIRSLNTN